MSHEPCAMCGLDRSQASGVSSDPQETRTQAQQLRGVLADLHHGSVQPAELAFKASQLCAMCQAVIQGDGASGADLEERLAGLIERLDEEAGAAETTRPAAPPVKAAASR